MSRLESQLALQISALKLPTPIREYKFYPGRKWRSDFLWSHEKLVVEVEGGIYSQGRHVRGQRFEADCEKYNHAVLQGFQVLRVTGKQIKSGFAVHWIEKMLMGVN